MVADKFNICRYTKTNPNKNTPPACKLPIRTPYTCYSIGDNLVRDIWVYYTGIGWCNPDNILLMPTIFKYPPIHKALISIQFAVHLSMTLSLFHIAFFQLFLEAYEPVIIDFAT